MTKTELMTRFMLDANAYLAESLPTFLDRRSKGIISDYDDTIPAALEAMLAISLALANNDDADAFDALLADDMTLEAIANCDFDSPLIDNITAPCPDND